MLYDGVEGEAGGGAVASSEEDVAVLNSKWQGGNNNNGQYNSKLSDKQVNHSKCNVINQCRSFPITKQTLTKQTNQQTREDT